MKKRNVINGWDALNCKQELVEIKTKRHKYQAEYRESTQERQKELLQEMTELENSIGVLELKYFG